MYVNSLYAGQKKETKICRKVMDKNVHIKYVRKRETLKVAETKSHSNEHAARPYTQKSIRSTRSTSMFLKENTLISDKES
jgi:hypothetical protein